MIKVYEVAVDGTSLIGENLDLIMELLSSELFRDKPGEKEYRISTKEIEEFELDELSEFDGF